MRTSSPPSTTIPRSPTPSNTPSVWVEALWAWPTLTRRPTQASGISLSDIVVSLRDRQLRLQHSGAFVQRRGLRRQPILEGGRLYASASGHRDLRSAPPRAAPALRGRGEGRP